MRTLLSITYGKGWGLMCRWFAVAHLALWLQPFQRHQRKPSHPAEPCQQCVKPLPSIRHSHYLVNSQRLRTAFSLYTWPFLSYSRYRPRAVNTKEVNHSYMSTQWGEVYLYGLQPLDYCNVQTTGGLPAVYTVYMWSTSRGCRRDSNPVPLGSVPTSTCWGCAP